MGPFGRGFTGAITVPSSKSADVPLPVHCWRRTVYVHEAIVVASPSLPPVFSTLTGKKPERPPRTSSSIPPGSLLKSPPLTFQRPSRRTSRTSSFHAASLTTLLPGGASASLGIQGAQVAF